MLNKIWLNRTKAVQVAERKFIYFHDCLHIIPMTLDGCDRSVTLNNAERWIGVPYSNYSQVCCANILGEFMNSSLLFVPWLWVKWQRRLLASLLRKNPICNRNHSSNTKLGGFVGSFSERDLAQNIPELTWYHYSIVKYLQKKTPFLWEYCDNNILTWSSVKRSN